MDKDQFLMELYEEAYETEISDEQMEKLKKIANEDDSFNKAMVAKILVIRSRKKARRNFVEVNAR